MSEDDDATAAETSLRRAVEQLCGDGAGDGSEAAQEAVQALADGSGKAWTPEQETQIRAMVEQIRKLRDLNRPGGGWWRRRREWRARERLVDMMEAGGPELLNEAELRQMKQDDVVKVLAQREAVNAMTYEDYQRAKKALAEKKAAAS